ncbi:hypothetical protein QQM41_10065 [Acetobacter sp. AC2005]
MEYDGPMPRMISISIAIAISSIGIASILFGLAQVIHAIKLP